MLSSSPTVPADSSKNPLLSPIADRVFGFAIGGVWLFLLIFAIISTLDPEWLQNLGTQDLNEMAMNFKFQGDKMLRAGKHDEALLAYRAALDLNPDEPSIVGNVAITYLQMGQMARALSTFEYMLGKDLGEKGVLLFNMADIQERQNNFIEAEQLFQEAAVEIANPTQTYRRLGALRFKRKQWAAAQKAFQNAVDSQIDTRTHIRAVLLKALIQYKAEPEALAEINRQLSELSSETGDRFDKWLYNSVLARDRELAKTYNYLGKVSEKLDKRDTAKQYYDKAVLIWPDYPEGRQNLARLKRDS